MEIFADDREGAVIPFMESIFKTSKISEGIEMTVKRLYTGDYAIIYNDQILLVIERKTWVDLAQSFRDGRKDNVKKLISLREKTGCRIAYIIEGPPCPKPNKKYSRTPVKNLRAHLDHISIRDNILIIHTTNAEHTAYRLFELAKNISTIKGEILGSHDSLEKSNESTADGINVLTTKQKTIINMRETLLRNVPSVGSIRATVLADNNISVFSIYNGHTTINDIALCKQPTGNSIGLVTGKKIYKAIKSINKPTKIGCKIALRLLRTVQGISKETASEIHTKYGIKNILSGEITVEDLSQFKKGKRNLGLTIAKRLYDAFEITNVAGKADNQTGKADNKSNATDNQDADDNQTDADDSDSSVDSLFACLSKPPEKQYKPKKRSNNKNVLDICDMTNVFK